MPLSGESYIYDINKTASISKCEEYDIPIVQRTIVVIASFVLVSRELGTKSKLYSIYIPSGSGAFFVKAIAQRAGVDDVNGNV